MRYYSMMNRRVDESYIKSLAHNIHITNPELENEIRKDYSKRSGIDIEYIDLLTALRGFVTLGLM